MPACTPLPVSATATTPGPLSGLRKVLPMEEILLFDPQTSGGLLFAVAPQDAAALEAELQAAGLPAKIVGHVQKADAGDYSNIRMMEEQSMIKIDARGDACPLPWSRAKKAIASCAAPARWKCWWTMRSLSRT